MNQVGEITQQLIDINKGDQKAYNAIFPLIYMELRHITHRKGIHYEQIEALPTNAIIHEAYLKLIDSETNWMSRAHFYAVAGKAMRKILINRVKRGKAINKGKKDHNLAFEAWQEKIHITSACASELLSLETFLNQLTSHDTRLIKIIECKFFAGMTIEETATVLNMSAQSIKPNWESLNSIVTNHFQLRKTA